jgi:rhodanese-related sulfurtransferase
MRIRTFAVTAIVAAAASVGLVGCSSGDDTASVTTIGPTELIEVAADPDVVILDVRTPEEFAQGHVPGAVNIDMSSPTFPDAIAELPKDTRYVVYCRSGNRSADAAGQMADAGFTDLYDVDAGLATLSAAGVALTQ